MIQVSSLNLLSYEIFLESHRISIRSFYYTLNSCANPAWKCEARVFFHGRLEKPYVYYSAVKYSFGFRETVGQWLVLCYKE